MSGLIYEMLNVHVNTPDAEVRAELRKRLRPDANPAEVARIEEDVIAEHHAAADLYADVMGGRI